MTIDSELLAGARSSDADVRQKAASALVSGLDDASLGLAFEMLGDRDWRVRKTIVEGLLVRRDRAVTRGLLESLRDPDNAGKRNSATEALIRIGDEALDDILDMLASESDPDVRLSLVNLLGDIRAERGFHALVALLPNEEDINIVSSIATSLGRYRDARAVGPLIRALERPDLWMKFHIIEALGEIGDRAALPAILPLYSEKSLRKPVLEAIGKIGDIGTVNFLLKVIASEEKLNLIALRALMMIADAERPRVVESVERQTIQRRFRESFSAARLDPMVEHLHATPRRDVRNFLLRFMGWSQDLRALPPILAFLEQPDTADVAAQALIDFGAGATPAVLQKLQQTDEDEITSVLLRVINFIGGADAVPAILAFLDHPNPLIRRQAIETLGEVPDPRSIDYLLARLDDDEVGCQQAAVNSISALATAFPEAKPALLAKIRRLLVSPSVPAKLNSLSVFVNVQGEGYPDELLLASKDQDPAIRQKAVSLMGRYSDEQFADQIVLSLADEAAPVRLAAIEAATHLRPERALGALQASLEDEDLWIRAASAQALGEYRDAGAIEALRRHAQKDVQPVRIAALEALGKIGEGEVAETLFSAAEDDDPEIRRSAILAMARVPGDAVRRKLVDSLDDADWRIRSAAVTALGQREDKSTLPLIHERLFEDDDPYVQQSAVSALHRMVDRSSFPFLLRALENPAIVDEVSDLLIRHRDIFREPLEEAWRKADNRSERVIAAIMQAMRD